MSTVTGKTCASEMPLASLYICTWACPNALTPQNFGFGIVDDDNINIKLAKLFFFFFFLLTITSMTAKNDDKWMRKISGDDY